MHLITNINSVSHRALPRTLEDKLPSPALISAEIKASA